jgi:threonine dehydratase
MDEACESRYHPKLLTTNVSARHITLSAIRDAAGAIYQAAIRTPLVRIETGLASPAELYLKLETLQPIGSFKLRGAYNVVRQLTPAQLQEGVWTVSAGNAAQGVGPARAAR